MLKKQVIRFIIVGTINTAFYYTLFSLFIFLSIDYKFSVLFATIIGVIFSYFMFGKFVFANNRITNFSKFIFVYILLYFINIGLIFCFEIFVSNYYISGFLAMIICAILSYILNKKIVFTKKE